jgi:hypothetical protein
MNGSPSIGVRKATQRSPTTEGVQGSGARFVRVAMESRRHGLPLPTYGGQDRKHRVDS